MDGMTLEKDDLSGRLKEAEQKVRLLYEITRIVSSYLDLQHVLDAIVDLLVNEFGLDLCSIIRVHKDGSVSIESFKGLGELLRGKYVGKFSKESYIGKCLSTGEILIIKDTDQAGVSREALRNLLISEDIKSFALCPIKFEDEIIGLLGTASTKKNYFYERFNDIIYTISSQIGIAIRISQLYGEIYSFSQDLEKKVEERTAELEARTQQLIAAERRASRVEMSNVIAHELRNSLTIVGGFARRFYEKYDDTKADKKDMKIIIDEIRVLEDKVAKIIKLGSDNS
jgi:GAF domain-containing protein